MRMIEDLFYGNICPCEKSLTRGSEYSHLLDLAVKNEENLSALLSPQQKEVFEKLKECMTDMNNILEKEAFIDGLRLGLKLMAESVYDKSSDI
ncbi:MAG: hypothetical protein J6D06_03470 [Clostridia bacterium]|nr:hypothetical protein [Clostridia bacterium]